MWVKLRQMNLNKQQRTLAMMTGFEQYTKKTRRAIFLEEMEQLVPWRELCALVEPHFALRVSYSAYHRRSMWSDARRGKSTNADLNWRARCSLHPSENLIHFLTYVLT